jgi:hydroxymethylpyrimidine pyrophosphatase-like HAD family hydrolase
MGRPYEEELALLPATVQWISGFDIGRALAQAYRLADQNLIVVASGGSGVPAQLFAQIHMTQTSRLAVAMTPLEFMAEGPVTDAYVWFISAGGSNVDILRAWDEAKRRGITHIGLLCGAPESLLAKRAQAAHLDSAIVFELPSGRDGFLATNSLVAFCVLILRLYRVDIPAIGRATLGVQTLELLKKNTLIVLFGGWLKSVATDIESRFTEAALGSVQLADYRNFAHGRHHWLAKRGSDTAILALVSPRYAELAQRTLKSLPPEIPTDVWSFESDTPGDALLGLTKSMALAQVAAQRSGYDAGRPGVPIFGHEIYELDAAEEITEPSAGALAIARKRRNWIAAGWDREAEIAEALARFRHSLATTLFAGVVLDYDGTLVSTQKRFQAIESEVAGAINQFLDQGMLLGVATGRGKSIHARLREVIAPRYWGNVTIGYYNGGVLRSLSESCELLSPSDLPSDVQDIAQRLAALPELARACFEPRATQITISSDILNESELWKLVSEYLARWQIEAFRVVQSSHSIDVIRRGVSKLNVVAELALKAKSIESSVLKIGDRGRWPGNDFELLGTTHGLSVDEVSSSAASCWNLLPRGILGPQGTVYYLSHVKQGRYVD